LCEFLLQFPEAGRQRSKMAYRSLFVVNISPSFAEFTAPLRHILPIHNLTINSNNLFVNFRWSFTFWVEKSYDGIHLAFGGTLDWALPFQTRLTQTKSVLPLSNEHGSQVKDQGRRQFCDNMHKKFPYRPTHDVSFLFGHASYSNGLRQTAIEKQRLVSRHRISQHFSPLIRRERIYFFICVPIH
jgi:hypothetical protein